MPVYRECRPAGARLNSLENVFIDKSVGSSSRSRDTEQLDSETVSGHPARRPRIFTCSDTVNGGHPPPPHSTENLTWGLENNIKATFKITLSGEHNIEYILNVSVS